MKYTIAEVATMLGYTKQYVKHLIRKKLLESSKEPVFEGSHTLRHMVTQEQLDAFLARPNTRSRRSDSRNKFIFYAFPDEYFKIIEAVRQAGFEDVAKTMMPANTIKAIGFLYDPSENGSGRFVNVKD